MRWAPLSVSMVAYDGHPMDVALASLAALGIDVVELAYIEGYSATFDEALFSPSNARAADLPRRIGALRYVANGRRRCAVPAA